MTEKEEFCEQVRLYEKSMYNLAFSLVKNDSDAAEVISESLFRAYKNLDSLKNKKAFKSWILRIVHNTAVEMIRKNSKVIPIDTLEDAAEDSHENRVMTKLALKEAVEQLKQPYRTVVVLFYYEDIPLAKIAQITDTNVVCVKKQLSRARKMLQEALKGDFSQ